MRDAIRDLRDAGFTERQAEAIVKAIHFATKQHARTNRGRVNQRRAAEYLGRSREFLRQLHLRGEGPRRASDGFYSFDDLDSWAEQNK